MSVLWFPHGGLNKYDILYNWVWCLTLYHLDSYYLSYILWYNYPSSEYLKYFLRIFFGTTAIILQYWTWGM